MNMSRNSIYKAAIKEYGEVAQLDMVLEECAELSKAILKFRRAVSLSKKLDFDKQQELVAAIEDEAADVSIMLEQIPLIFDGMDIEARKELKVTRLARRLGLEDAHG
jgi:NTP pyrophosphatase (non-canonical NTP hydrolase)